MTTRTKLWNFNETLEDSYGERKFHQFAGHIPRRIFALFDEEQGMELLDALEKAIDDAIPDDERKFHKLVGYIPSGILPILTEEQGMDLLNAFREAIDAEVAPHIGETAAG